MQFDTCGPFNYPKERIRLWKKRFWDDVEEYWPGLPNAVGCYAFCIDNGRTVRPWYVGKTLSQYGFKGEIFEQHKMDHYNSIMGSTENGQPRRGEGKIILFPLLTDTWGLSKNRSSSNEYIDWLETALIGMALAKNPEIANSSKTRFHKTVYVHGLIGRQQQGRPNKGAIFARSAFS